MQIIYFFLIVLLVIFLGVFCYNFLKGFSFSRLQNKKAAFRKQFRVISDE